MILIEDILILHELSLQDYGGASGIRDMGMLESAISRPFQTFDGLDLYPSVIEKAAALGESLIINHPFVDGNKRTGMLAMLSFLSEHGISVTASKDSLYTFIISISSGETGFEEIVAWLKQNSARR